jgi:hypothetical protein
MPLVELSILPRPHDLGGFSVRRVLPSAARRMVGPFIFLDHMGPAAFPGGKGVDVRPHPHIGLATVTYLFDGELFHRDSLGNAQEIRPGAVNWMTAGRGIVHSERTGTAERAGTHNLHGLQSWVALPKASEETAPEFFHHPAASLPSRTEAGVTLKMIAGEAFGMRAPVKLYSPLFYADVTMQAGARLVMPSGYSERALYLIEGDLSAGDAHLDPLAMSVFRAGETVTLEARSPVHAAVLGGEPLGEERHIWWNFVSSSKERIEQAKRDWKERRLPKVPGDEEEFTPLPDN